MKKSRFTHQQIAFTSYNRHERRPNPLGEDDEQDRLQGQQDGCKAEEIGGSVRCWSDGCKQGDRLGAVREGLAKAGPHHHHHDQGGQVDTGGRERKRDCRQQNGCPGCAGVDEQVGPKCRPDGEGGLDPAREIRAIRLGAHVVYAASTPGKVPETARVRGAPVMRSPVMPQHLVSVVSALRVYPSDIIIQLLHFARSALHVVACGTVARPTLCLALSRSRHQPSLGATGGL